MTSPTAWAASNDPNHKMEDLHSEAAWHHHHHHFHHQHHHDHHHYDAATGVDFSNPHEIFHYDELHGKIAANNNNEHEDGVLEYTNLSANFSPTVLPPGPEDTYAIPKYRQLEQAATFKLC